MPTTDELRSLRIEDLGMAPRRGLGRWLRWWIVVGPLFVLFDTLRIHGIGARVRGRVGFHCYCGADVHITDERDLRLPPVVSGRCAVARLHRWAHWRRADRDIKPGNAR